MSFEKDLKNLLLIQEVDLKSFENEKFLNEASEIMSGLVTRKEKFVSNLEILKLKLEDFEKNLTEKKALFELNLENQNRAQKKIDLSNNTQEFHAANRELEHYKKLNMDLETEIAGLRLEHDKVTSDLDLKKNEISLAIEKSDSEILALTQKKERVLGELEELKAKRKLFVQEVSSVVFSKYDRIRKSRDGLGIAPVLKGACSGCRMKIAPQIANSLVKRDGFYQCSSCQRFVFLPNE